MKFPTKKYLKIVDNLRPLQLKQALIAEASLRRELGLKVSELRNKLIKTKKVFVLTIEHRHGTNMSVHDTKPHAASKLYNYIHLWWSDHIQKDKPKNIGKAIDMYFNINEDESWEIRRLEVQC